ncbi:hypothetical protein L2D08_10625 [Domibacillus sp. PGB-M46]|uniref:hypothetical protein n=1 Tax=Domibacillus sp. PGB-M46 TaxID=2910255 RepID=UPI001F566905|nr:hypothetical protein [Domibacillus sp. PGB-M46]MCI2254818.1 hypothetical protein [Domibacillus sp. PGB-M46]
MHFIVKAAMIERKFCCKMKTDAIFFTGKGFENYLHHVTDKTLYIKTSKGKAPLPLARKLTSVSLHDVMNTFL